MDGNIPQHMNPLGGGVGRNILFRKWFIINAVSGTTVLMDASIAPCVGLNYPLRRNRFFINLLWGNSRTSLQVAFIGEDYPQYTLLYLAPEVLGSIAGVHHVNRH